jgi:hypothetical protein
MKTTSDIVQELVDRSNEADELIEMAEEAVKLEACLADVKAILFSPFQPIDMKITNCKLAIEKAGY